MSDFECTVSHVLDKEVSVLQAIMCILDANKVTHEELERVLRLLRACVDDPRNIDCIRYYGE